MKLKLLFALLIVQLGFAQQRTCGTDEYMQRMMTDPVWKKQYLDLQQQFESELNRIGSENRQNGPMANSTNTIIRIPVAVHFPSVVNTSSETIKSCLRALSQKQIAILNADYNGTNADISNWTTYSSMFPGVSTGNMQVSWEIATQNHPAGTGLANGTLAVTFGTDFLSNADTDATWTGYCNLVLRNITVPANALGYSPVGGSPTGMTVVIDNAAFGAVMSPAPATCSGYVPGFPYNLGRTLTHELGHFFNLLHTFQSCDGGDCTNYGDKICDTPSCNQPRFDCNAPDNPPTGTGTPPITTCGETQLTMNYMDYVQDSCMYMFTAAQATRMLAWYNVIATQLATNVLGNNEFVTTNFSIAPNPNAGTFAIQMKEQNDQFSVLILDALGRIVYDNEFNQTTDLVQTIQLDGALSGVYFVTIESNGQKMTKKIIIE